MKFIYVLEDDERVQKDLFETLHSIDPKLHIRFFSTLAAFHGFLTAALSEGAKAIATHGEKAANDTSDSVEPSEGHELSLVIAKYEFFGKKNMGLIKRARDFFLRKKMCSEQAPTALVLTAFDSPDFDIALVEERIINNVIFKPFDKLILKQHLEFAITGRQPLTTATVASYKINSTIEMLKEVNLHTLNEIGFSTLNNQNIEIGAFRKYYNEAFVTDEKRSAYAQCVSSKETAPNTFLCEFQFFGLDNKQISEIRRKILQTKNPDTEPLHHSVEQKIRVLLLDEEGHIAKEIESFLELKFTNVEIFHYSAITQLLSDLSDKDTIQKRELPPGFDMVIANYDVFIVEKEKRWEMIKQALTDRHKKYTYPESNIPLYLISRMKIPLDEMRHFPQWVREIFFYPLDKNYMTRKLLKADPRFSNKEQIFLSSIKDQTPLKVANPVEITQISEAGLILKYYRQMSIGAFREFILWRPQELQTPEITGTVNYTEKAEGQDYYLNHFVFFGMKDHYLKHIRLWLLDAHIKTKDQS